VEVLPLRRSNFYAGANILGDERVVKYRDLRRGPAPIAILKDGGRADARVDNDVGWMLST